MGSHADYSCSHSANKMTALMSWLLILATFLFTKAHGTPHQRNDQDTSPTNCTYNLVINQIDPSKCPKLFGQMQNIQRQEPVMKQQTFFNGLETIVKQVQMLETKLYKEVAENRELKNNLLQQEQWLKQAQSTIESQQQNLSILLSSMSDVRHSMTKQRAYYRHIDNKLAGVMLDVVEVNNLLSQRTPMSNKKVEDKTILVQSASLQNTCGASPNSTKFRDCEDIYHNGHLETGVYYITPIYSACSIPVYCDMDTPPSGWTLIQRRQDGLQSFDHNWQEYRHGFGDITSDFWIGNDNLFFMTNQLHYELRVDLWDFYGSRVYATYRHFKIDGERDKYRLHVSNHSGTAPDGLSHHDQVFFSTPDRDYDSWPDYHCAKEWDAGWWFNNCWFVILNGPYHNQTDVKYRGISWNDWKAEQLKKVEMKIRPSGY